MITLFEFALISSAPAILLVIGVELGMLIERIASNQGKVKHD